MSYVNSARAAGVASLAAALLLAGAVTTTAEAGDGARQKAPAGQGAGGSWSRSSTVQRTPNGHTRQDQWQNQEGKSASRHVEVANDPTTGTRDRSAVWTGPEGRQTSVDTVTQRTESGRTSSTIATRDDGTTATRNTTVVNDRAAGTRSVDSTTTGFGDRTTTYSSDAQRNDDGYTRDVTRTLPDGQVNQHSIDVSCDPAARSCTKTVTHGDGG